MEELINELEKKQSEIWTDIEDMESTVEYAQGFSNGWDKAFDIAILIVKENSNLFKEQRKGK